MGAFHYQEETLRHSSPLPTHTAVMFREASMEVELWYPAGSSSGSQLSYQSSHYQLLLGRYYVTESSC